MPDTVPLCVGPNLSEERSEINVEPDDHVDEFAVETQLAQPPGIKRRHADQMSQPGPK